jgi:hypothetical protein
LEDLVFTKQRKLYFYRSFKTYISQHAVLSKDLRRVFKIQKFRVLIQEEGSITPTKRIENFLFMKSKERYLDFIKNNDYNISLSHFAFLMRVEC